MNQKISSKKLVKTSLLSAIVLLGLNQTLNAQSTTTIPGNLSVNDDFKARGEVVAEDTMRAQKDVLIDGNTSIGGNLRVGGEVFFNNSLNISKHFGIGYTPGSGSTPSILSFSSFAGRSIMELPGKVRGCKDFQVSNVTTFQDLVQVYNQNGTALSMGVLLNNNEGVIALEPTSASSSISAELSMNPNCSNSINMCYGGGFVTVAKNFEIGLKARKTNVALNIVNQTGITKSISVQDLSDQEMFALSNTGTMNLNTNGTNTSALIIKNSTVNKTIFEVLTSGSANINIVGTGASAFKINNTAVNKPVFEVENNGKTSIGIDRVDRGPHMDAMLSVGGNGKIACKEVRVFTINWADYVFEQNYKLMPLLDVENFYKTNKHLPNVPTTEQIMKEGNDLAKTDAMLLEKIEELTIYIVELKKEINALKQK